VRQLPTSPAQNHPQYLEPAGQQSYAPLGVA